MKLYLFLAIVVCKSCNYFSHAEYDSLVEWAGQNPSDADTSLEGASLAGFEWSPYGRAPWTSAVKRSAKADIQTRRRSALDKNFMRFGRADPHVVRYSRASNLMRFGRPDRNFLRFGRDGWPGGASELEASERVMDPDLSKEYATSTEQLEQRDDAGGPTVALKRNAGGGASEEMMSAGLSESGEQIRPKQIVYYRRDSPKNLMRFGKRRASGYMRFGRANLMRFGRRSDEPDPDELFGRIARAGPANLMRFGRAGNLMRFGRSGSSEPTAEGRKEESNQPSNGTASLPTEGGSPVASRAAASLPANLLELLDGDRLVQGMTKDQERLLLDAMEMEAGASRALTADERVPLYVVEK